MTTAHTWALSLSERLKRDCEMNWPDYDNQMAASAELSRLAAVDAEHDALRAQVADLTLSLEASERRVENHISLIKGYQAELAAAKAWVEALAAELDEAQEVILKLRGICPKCDGTGETEYYPSMDPACKPRMECCRACEGRGYLMPQPD